MKEIKFRAWVEVDIYNKGRSWVMDYFDFRSITLDGSCVAGKKYFFDIPDNKYIMQFTGLSDKNGKEIYEGDIISSEVKGQSQISVIVFMLSEFTAKYVNSSHPDFTHFTVGKGMQSMWWGTFSTIIGNIHENPDLIK